MEESDFIVCKSVQFPTSSCWVHVLDVEKSLGAGLVCRAASCSDNSWSLSLWFLLFLAYQTVTVACACSLAIFTVPQK